jgi:hypothetical protein
MLPEGRETAWLLDDVVSVVVARHTRSVNLAGVQTEITVPRLLLTFGESGPALYCDRSHAYRAVSNVWDDGRICYGENPTPQDPWEAWNFFWGGIFNTDLNQYGYHSPQDCPEGECAEHGLISDCPPTHYCQGPRGCRCDPPSCDCLAEHEHKHGYKTTSCDCCEGRCSHEVEVCKCAAANWECACDSGDCSCEPEGPCTPTDEDGDNVCGCGQVDKWREKVKAATPQDYVGDLAPETAYQFPDGAAGWRPGTGEVVDRAGQVIAKIPRPEVSLEGYKYKVGDFLRCLPLALGEHPPSWWQHYNYVGTVSNVTRLLPGRFYQLDVGHKVHEDYLEGAFENWAYPPGTRVSLLEGRHAGRSLLVTSCHMTNERGREYYLEGLRGTHAQHLLRLAYADAPHGPAPVVYKYPIDSWVKLTPASLQSSHADDIWEHWIGVPVKVTAQLDTSSGSTYRSSGFVGRIPEDCLEKADAPPVYGIQIGSRVRTLRRPNPSPLWWPDSLPEGHTFNVTAAPGADIGRRRTYFEAWYGLRVPEQCLEVISGPAPVSEGPVIYRPTCGYAGCRQPRCNVVTYLNPNYPAPPYNLARELRVGATVKVLNVKGTTESERLAAVGATRIVSSVEGEGDTLISLEGSPWVFSPDDLEVLS